MQTTNKILHRWNGYPSKCYDSNQVGLLNILNSRPCPIMVPFQVQGQSIQKVPESTTDRAACRSQCNSPAISSTPDPRDRNIRLGHANIGSVQCGVMICHALSAPLNASLLPLPIQTVHEAHFTPWIMQYMLGYCMHNTEVGK